MPLITEPHILFPMQPRACPIIFWTDKHGIDRVQTDCVQFFFPVPSRHGDARGISMMISWVNRLSHRQQLQRADEGGGDIVLLFQSKRQTHTWRYQKTSPLPLSCELEMFH